MKQKPTDAMVCVGEGIKALDDSGRIGGYLVRFSTEKDPDLSGDFFTAKTYFGPRDGDGADVLFHHGLPLKSGLEGLADHVFAPMKTRRDEVGIWAEAVLNLADAYERKVHELAVSGKLGWSSGTAKYLIRKDERGEIKRWPIIEGSLTPTPAEPRNSAGAIKSLSEFLEGDEAPETRSAIEQIKTWSDFEKFVRDARHFPLSRSEAKFLASTLDSVAQRDVGDVDEKTREIAALKFALRLADFRAVLNPQLKEVK